VGSRVRGGAPVLQSAEERTDFADLCCFTSYSGNLTVNAIQLGANATFRVRQKKRGGHSGTQRQTRSDVVSVAGKESWTCDVDDCV